MPTLEEFFEEAIEQADPENMVENKYKYVHLCCVLLDFNLFHVWLVKENKLFSALLVSVQDSRNVQNLVKFGQNYITKCLKSFSVLS